MATCVAKTCQTSLHYKNTVIKSKCFCWCFWQILDRFQPYFKEESDCSFSIHDKIILDMNLGRLSYYASLGDTENLNIELIWLETYITYQDLISINVVQWRFHFAHTGLTSNWTGNTTLPSAWQMQYSKMRSVVSLCLQACRFNGRKYFFHYTFHDD